MQKLAASFFLSVILLAQTPVQQVLRLPILLQHFSEHRAENSAISFLQFIELHYFSNHPKDADYDRDQQLPFRSDDVVLMSSTVVLPTQIAVDCPPPIAKEPTIIPENITSTSAAHTFDIWQPPRVS